MRFSGRGWGGRGYALGTTSALVVDFLVTPSGGFRLGLPLAFNLTLGFRRECLMNAVEMIVSNICERFVAEERMPVPLCVQTSEYEEDLLLVPRLARLLDTVLPDGDGKARIWWLTPYAAAAISELREYGISAEMAEFASLDTDVLVSSRPAVFIDLFLEGKSAMVLFTNSAAYTAPIGFGVAHVEVRMSPSLKELPDKRGRLHSLVRDDLALTYPVLTGEEEPVPGMLEAVRRFERFVRAGQLPRPYPLPTSNAAARVTTMAIAQAKGCANRFEEILKERKVLPSLQELAYAAFDARTGYVRNRAGEVITQPA